MQPGVKPVPPLQQAAQLLNAGDLAGVERLLAPHIAQMPDTNSLQLMGLVRMRQQRLEDAVDFFTRALAVAPKQAQVQFYLGRCLTQLGRFAPAIAALQAAVTLKPDFADAWYVLASAFQATGRLQEAEAAYRRLLQIAPGHLPGKLGLGTVLMAADRLDDAEAELKDALALISVSPLPVPPDVQAGLHNYLGIVAFKQRKSAEALKHVETAQALDPNLTSLDVYRADLLQQMRRSDEAVAVFQKMLARDAANPTTHHDYNDLLYRLGRDNEFLKSYDRGPQTAALLHSKATLLAGLSRDQDAHDVYAQLLAREPGNKAAATGQALALSKLGRHGDAVRVYERLLARHDGDADLYGNAATALICDGDPKAALALCEKGLTLAPHGQYCLALKGTALRLLEDERDEILNGYDTLIRSFDLEAPRGFSSMADFNAELGAYLESLHPDTREYIGQSLRGGTQTPNHLFGAGHELVDRIAERIRETVARYIAELPSDERHPFLARRRKDFSVPGSWSSRLRDCGFHVNHIHPAGWISSCYYVGVPDVVQDEKARQGWIKFGEPGFAAALKNPIRRAIQPVPGRLVLFPSYMWHGTVPFRAAASRTTIAFDAVPV